MGKKYGTSPLYGPRPELGSMDNGLPKALNNVGIDQKLGEQVPLDLMFRDEAGREVRLSEYFNQGRPVIISLVYYECPMLCNQVLNGLAGSLKTLSFDVGKEFDVVTVSFDARETPQLAAAKKDSYMARYNRAGAEKGWHFLTGDEKNINALTQAVGFRYAYDETTNQFAHASGIMLATPEGKLARYFYGIEYAPKDMRLSIVEASANKVGSPVDALMLYCFHYDPATGKYGLAIMNVVRLGGILTVLGIIALLIALATGAITLTRSLKTGGAA
ncbi:MAG: SCO family protein [Pyrinomonadaceae bacterium]|nr:SCO family protein [Pyrinomonadaceae bacterium]